MRPLNSLRARLTAAMTLLFAVWVALACAGLFAYFRYAVTARAERRLTIIARDVADDLREETAHGALDAASRPRVIAVLEEEEREVGPRTDLARMVIDPRGRMVWRSQRAVPPWPYAGKDWRIVTLPAGPNTVVLALGRRQVREELREQAAGLLLLGALAVAAAALGSWVLVGRTLSPIDLLSRHAQEASAESLQIQLQAPSDDAEIVELVATLNDLLGRLADTAAARGRFYAAASHELRTPLQALSGHLEVALSRERTGEAYRAAIGEALTQTRRLTRLAQDLLLLNRLEAVPPEAGEPVDLAEVCARVLRQMQPVVATRGLRISAENVASALLLAPPIHVEALVRNLVDNAVRYASPGGEVRLATDRREGGTVLTVFDECPPVDGWDPAAPFEAFARADRSRSRRTGGNGLGLAICGEIAKVNAWSISLRHDGHGLLATAVFPERPGDAAGPGREPRRA